MDLHHIFIEKIGDIHRIINNQEFISGLSSISEKEEKLELCDIDTLIYKY